MRIYTSAFLIAILLGIAIIGAISTPAQAAAHSNTAAFCRYTDGGGNDCGGTINAAAGHRLPAYVQGPRKIKFKNIRLRRVAMHAQKTPPRLPYQAAAEWPDCQSPLSGPVFQEPARQT